MVKVVMKLNRMTDETRLYNCGGLPVELTLPEGEHEENWGYPFEWEIELISELAEYDDF